MKIVYKIALIVFSTYFTKAQSDSLFTGWNYPAPSSMDVPIAKYYYFKDTLKQPWDVGIFPNPNNGNFILSSNRYTETVQLKITELNGKEIYNKQVNIKDFASAAVNLKLKPGLYHTIIKKSTYPEIIRKMAVQAQDTLHLDLKKTEGKTQTTEEKWYANVTPSYSAGKVAVVSNLYKNYEVIVTNKWNEEVYHKLIETLDGVYVLDKIFESGKHKVKIINPKKEVQEREFKVVN